MRNRDRVLSILLFLVVVTAGVFWQVRGFDFVDYDDNELVYENPYYSPATAQSLPSFWRQPYLQLYIPVTYTAWSILTSMARVVPLAGEAPLSQLAPTLDPSIFHSANLLLHVLSVLLVFGILRLLVKNDWAAACGALLFGLHPVQVESVAWISELKGVLCGFFALLATWLYLLSAFAINANQSTPENKAKSSVLKSASIYALATLAFMLALLSKPAAASLPLVLIVLELGVLKRKPKQYLPFVLPWLAIMVFAIISARSSQPVPSNTMLWQRPFIAGDALAFYLAKLFYPLNLAIHYSRTPEKVLQHWWVYLQWLVPVFVLALCWWQRRRQPWLLAGTGIFFVSLLPVLGLIPFAFQMSSTVADRYFYIPMLGPSLALAGLLALTLNRDDSIEVSAAGKLQFAKWPLLACSLVLLICAVLSFRQAAHWRDRARLYERALAVNPDSWVAYTNLGSAMYRLEEFALAEKYFREAIRLDPNNTPEARLNLGLVLTKQGRLNEAEAQYQELVSQRGELVHVYFGLGVLAGIQNDFAKAERVLREGVSKNADWAPIHVAFGLVLLLRNDKAGGIREIEAARIIDPSSTDTQLISILEEWTRGKNLTPFRESKELSFQWAQAYNNIGQSELRQQKLDSASVSFRKAIQAKPDFANAHNSLGTVLAQQGKLKEATIEFREAVRLSPHNVDAMANLATALSDQGRKTEAIQILQRALKIQPDFPRAQQLLNQL